MTRYLVRDKGCRDLVHNTVSWLSDEHPNVLIRAVIDADLSSMRRCAQISRHSRRLFIDPRALSSYSELGIQWIVCHEFGHATYWHCEDRGFRFAYDLTPADATSKVSAKCAKLLDDKEEVFAEIFAAEHLRQTSYTNAVRAQYTQYT